MKWIEIIKLSIQNLRRRKLRTFLTVLGVSIGTASIVVMVSLGIGLNYSYVKQIENSSTLTLIRVYRDWNGAGPGQSAPSSAVIDRDTVAGFADMEHVSVSSPVYSFGVYAQYGKYEGTLQIQAVSLKMLQALNLPVLAGGLPNEGDAVTLVAGRSVGYGFSDSRAAAGEKRVIMDDALRASSPDIDLLNATLLAVYDLNGYRSFIDGERPEMPRKYLLKTSAVIGRANAGAEFEYTAFDYSIYADIDAVDTLFKKIFKKEPWPNQPVSASGRPVYPMTYDEAYVMVDDIDHVDSVQKHLTDLGYMTSSEMDYLKSMQEQSRMIQYTLGGIGSVALIVATIGIMNTMMMSVLERTKEIGIFKVLGCSLRNIRYIFLTESGVIGITGGMVGLVISLILSSVINLLIGEISIIPVPLALLGIGFSVTVGIAAGMSPAIKATRLSPLEAIRAG